jgi:AraC-like DNA-binding protein
MVPVLRWLIRWIGIGQTGRAILSKDCLILRVCVFSCYFVWALYTDSVRKDGDLMLDKSHGTAAQGEALADRQDFAETIARMTVGKDGCDTAIPGLTFFRRDTVEEPRMCLVEPSVIIVVQGAKQLIIGNRAYVYDAKHYLIASLEVPGSSQVLDASPRHPCLGLVLKLNLHTLAELASRESLPLPQAPGKDVAASIGELSSAILEPFHRLVALLEEPEAIPVLAPMIEREIHYRLLHSSQIARLLQVVSVGSQSHRIARVINWLKANYSEPLRIEDLAEQARMSASSLHHHFRQLTAMSPLQYQKWLRLNEARRLMLNEGRDAAAAAFQVGYDSPSQFSREYARLFGLPPRRDIGSLRKSGLQA